MIDLLLEILDKKKIIIIATHNTTVKNRLDKIIEIKKQKIKETI